MSRYAILLGLVGALVAPRSLEAGFTVDAVYNSPVNVLPGESGGFDVVLTNTGDAALGIAAFQFTIDADGGVQFTDANYSTDLPYIFEGVSTNQFLGDPLSFDSFPSASLTASDTYFDLGGFTVQPGESFALGHLSFTSPITFPVAANITLRDVIFVDAEGAEIPFSEYSLQSGQILPEVGSGVVPEPSSFTLMAGLGALGMAGVSWRRGRFLGMIRRLRRRSD